MINVDSTGKGVLQFVSEGVIRRIPLERTGMTKHGIPWTIGGCLLEVGEEGVEGSAMLYLVTFDTEKIETINMLGVGKKVRVKYHIETKDYFDGYRVSVILDEICLPTEAENFLVGNRK